MNSGPDKKDSMIPAILLVAFVAGMGVVVSFLFYVFVDPQKPSDWGFLYAITVIFWLAYIKAFSMAVIQWGRETHDGDPWA